MRFYTFLSFLICSTVAFANSDVVLTDISDAQGHRVQFRTDTDSLARTPEWKPGTQEPPLTVSAAYRIAIEAGKRRLPKADDIAIESISLRKTEHFGTPDSSSPGTVVRWHYEISISPIFSGETFMGRSATIILILLDGSVFEPTPVK